MLCPLCGFDNLDGADSCDACKTSLMDEPSPRRRRNLLEGRIARDPLASLSPAEPVTVSPSDSVGEVVALLARRNIGCALVAHDGRLVGIFTERDVLMKIGVDLAKAGQRPVREFMTSGPETLLYSDPLAFALNRMAVGDYRHIPIERDGKPTGIISVRDVLAFITRKFPDVLKK